MTLDRNSYIGVGPDAIIQALRNTTKRLKYNQRKAADYAANREWHRAYNQYRYRTGRLLSGWRRKTLRMGPT